MRAFPAQQLLAAALASGLAAPAWAAPIDLPDIPRCTQLTPGAISVDYAPATLHVRVVLDGVTRAIGEQTVATAQTSYLPQNIHLQASYDQADFSNRAGSLLIEEAKRHYGGRRPDGVHLVYVLTAKNLVEGTIGDGLAGMADCIGGIAYPENAFAVGESRQFAAEIMAHELGHLLGGHHHYANCVESLPNGGQNLCTLMINDVGLAGLPLSSLNGTVVRGHAQLFGGPPPATGGPDGGSGGSGSGGGLPASAALALLGLWVLRRLSRGR